MLLNIASIRRCTESEGIGKRFAIWTQGCMKRCKNCCNHNMQSFVAKNIIDSEIIIKDIKLSKEKYNIEGITLIGGEPILQSKGLSCIAKYCKENGLSVILFSGYTLEEIKEKEETFEGLSELLKYTDVLIDGEYIEELYDESRGFIGSSNQKVYFFTSFYNEEVFYRNRNYISVDILVNNNSVSLNGWPCNQI